MNNKTWQNVLNDEQIKLKMRSRLINRYTKELTFLIGKNHTNRQGISYLAIFILFTICQMKKKFSTYLRNGTEPLFLNLLSLKISINRNI